MEEKDQRDPVAPLDGTPAIERVITQEQQRLFRASTIIMYLDNPYLNFHGVFLDLPNPCPVKDDTGKTIGSALLVHEGHSIRADLVFDYHTPERLSIETEMPLFAIPVGDMIYDAYADCLSRYNSRDQIHVRRVAISHIRLVGYRPDSRLEPLRASS